MITISLQSEYVLEFLGLPLTNTFLTSVLVTFLLTIGALVFYFKKEKMLKLGFFHKYVYVGIYEILKLADSVTHDRKLSRRILPLIATLFIFIASTNLIALIPGFLGSFYVLTEAGEVPILRSPNSDLTTTLALAFVAVVSIQYFSFTRLGLRGYAKRFINFGSLTKFITGLFEILSELVKILSYAFRLFGNVFAGEVLLMPYVIPLPFMMLEVFVSIAQAFIFGILTLTYIKTSTMRHA